MVFVTFSVSCKFLNSEKLVGIRPAQKMFTFQARLLFKFDMSSFVFYIDLVFCSVETLTDQFTEHSYSFCLGVSRTLGTSIKD